MRQPIRVARVRAAILRAIRTGCRTWSDRQSRSIETIMFDTGARGGHAPIGDNSRFFVQEDLLC